jgi:CubicO group peptidase (beta-lactamase class C family)
VAWDDPVREYLPGFRLADPTITERLTVRDLLTHRSGLPRHDLAWYGSQRSREELIEALRHLELSADLRQRFQYQNLMYLTAGYLSGEVAGSTWEALLEERIFEPLGMDETVISRFEGLPEVAAGYNLDLVEPEEGSGAGAAEWRMIRVPYRVIEAMGPAGSVNSNVDDMARRVRFQLGDGTFGGARILEETTLLETRRPQMVASLPIAGMIGPEMSPYILYGLGWFIQPYRGERVIHHGGNIDGFSAMVAFLPDHDLGIVVLSNANGSPLPLAVALSAFDRLLGLPPVDWVGKAAGFLEEAIASVEEERAAASAERVEGTSPSHPLEDYAGEYAHPGYGLLRVAHGNGELAFTLNGLEGVVEHWHYDVFNAEAGPLGDVKLEFLSSLDGRIDRVQVAVEPALPPVVFQREPPAELSDPALLARLAGEYLLMGQTVTVAVRGDTLTVAVPGQPAYEVVPVHGTEFALEELPSYRVRFHVDLDGTGPATGLDFVQPNGTFTAERKEE